MRERPEPKGENEKCVRALWRRHKRCVRLGGELMPLFPTCVNYLMSPTRFPFAPPCTCMMCNVMQYSTAPIKLELELFGN